MKHTADEDWANSVISELRKGLGKDADDFLNMWRDSENYVFEFFKHSHRTFGAFLMDVRRAEIVENSAVDVLNKYHSELIRKQLKHHKQNKL